MARFTAQINVGEQVYRTFKIAVAATDDDIGKPVKLSATDLVELCGDGDQIYGFIASLEVGTADGLAIVGVLVSGRIKIITDGTVTIGGLVEAAANTAIGVAKAGDYGLASAHTLVAATKKQWAVVSGAILTTGKVVLIEKQ